MVNEKDLITKLQSLKQIKPNQEWVALAKKQIFEQNVVSGGVVGEFANNRFMGNFLNLVFQKKISYALVALLFVMVGSFGILKYGSLLNTDTSNKSSVALVEVKNNVEIFKEKSKDLARVAKDDPKGLSLAITDVNTVANQITEKIQKNPQLAKEVALEINNNKTYLSISGSAADQLKEEPLNNLYETIVRELIKDLEQMSLSESKQKSLDRIIELADQGKFLDALEDALLLSATMENK